MCVKRTRPHAAGVYPRLRNSLSGSTQGKLGDGAQVPSAGATSNSATESKTEITLVSIPCTVTPQTNAHLCADPVNKKRDNWGFSSYYISFICYMELTPMSS